MASTLRDLLIQRAARLQDRPALSAPDWGTLSYAQLRNRVEGVALGLLAGEPPSRVCSATGTVWDWAAELAAAASGLVWDPTGQGVPPGVLGGPLFNAEGGRGPYHAREQAVLAATPFCGGLTHGDLLGRLRKLNGQLGWDHTTRVDLPLAHLAEPALRAALWSALYAGAHAVLAAEPTTPTGLLARLRKPTPPWDDRPFLALWSA
jgi:acyl-CoA synthetase (AMP-forming)/AMP-acid ligase II